MINTKKTLFAFFVITAIVFSACTKKASEEIDIGTFEDSVYNNDYFGFKMTLPSDWSVQDQQAIKQMKDIGAEIIAGDDKNLKAAIKYSEMQVVTLLAAFKHPVGAPVSFNPNISCVAERIRHAPGIKTGKDYLYHSRSMLESGQLQYSFPKEIYTEKLGGVDFDILCADLTVGQMMVHQKFYVAVIKGYALTFTVSFTDEEEGLREILESVSFN